MPVTIPTTTEIRDQIIADIDGAIGQVTPILTKAFNRVLASALAGVQTLCYRFGQWVFRQIFASTADRDALLLRGAQYGLAPTPAVAAILTADVVGVDPTVIPAGTLWATAAGVVYSQTAAVTISGSAAVITVEALTTGIIGNLEIGDTISLTSPLAGVTTDATIASTTTTGVDAESTASFRAEVEEREKNRPQGGATPDFVQWQLEVPGIVKAFAYRLTAGFATCYPMISLTGTAGERLPGGAKLAEVQAYLEDLIRKPLQSTPLATLLTEVSFFITVTGLSPDSAELRVTIEAAITSYLLERFAKQYDDETAPTDVISTASLSGIAVDAGMQSGVVTMNIGASDITTYTLASGELALFGSITWV